MIWLGDIRFRGIKTLWFGIKKPPHARRRGGEGGRQAWGLWGTNWHFRVTQNLALDTKGTQNTRLEKPKSKPGPEDSEVLGSEDCWPLCRPSQHFGLTVWSAEVTNLSLVARGPGRQNGDCHRTTQAPGYYPVVQTPHNSRR